MNLMDKFAHDDDAIMEMCTVAEQGAFSAMEAYRLGMDVGAMRLIGVGTLSVSLECDLFDTLVVSELTSADTLEIYAAITSAGGHIDILKSIKRCYIELMIPRYGTKRAAKSWVKARLEGIENEVIRRYDYPDFCANGNEERGKVLTFALLETGNLEAQEMATLLRRLCYNVKHRDAEAEKEAQELDQAA